MKKFGLSNRGVALLAVVGCALTGFSALFVRLRGVFADPLEDMSFGWLVPVFSLYVLWTERKELQRSLGEPSLAGLLACLPCALLALLGTRGLQMRFEQLGFIGLCVTLPWAFCGWQMARQFVFPALYLAFTIPLSSFLDVVTIHLRLLASGTALAVLKGIGLEVVQQGTAIYAQGAHPFSIDVAEPCSGLRSLFALMALTGAYAWFNQPTWTRRAMLFACSVPLAVLGNVTRILSICLVAAWGSPSVATGFYHDYSGYVVFIVAIALMVACGEAITRVAEKLDAAKGTKAEKPAEEPAAVEAAPRGAGGLRAKILPWCTAVLLCPIFLFQATTPQSTLTDPPKVVLPYMLANCEVDEVRFCQREQCAAVFPLSRLEKGTEGQCPLCGGELGKIALGERTVLPADTEILKRIYRTPRGDQFLVSAVIGGKSKSSIHRPELCLPAQGYQMQRPVDFTVGAERRPFHAVGLQRPGLFPATMAYTFFNQAGLRTASHVRRIFADTWDRSVFNRIDRWVMVTVFAQNAQGFSLDRPGDRHAFEQFLSALMETMP